MIVAQRAHSSDWVKVAGEINEFMMTFLGNRWELAKRTHNSIHSHELCNNHATLVRCTSSDILCSIPGSPSPRTKRLVQDFRNKVGKPISPTMTVGTVINLNTTNATISCEGYFCDLSIGVSSSSRFRA